MPGSQKALVRRGRTYEMERKIAISSGVIKKPEECLLLGPFTSRCSTAETNCTR